jgi:hypothetical protein
VSSVAENLLLFRGVWHDHISAYAPSGVELTEDPLGGSPGPVPYEQLVYLDIEGGQFVQTNVVLRGRDPHARTFRGSIVDGVLVFDRLGPQAPEMVGVSGGPGVLVFAPRRIDEEGTTRFHDPDYIRHLGGDQRTRTTTLYRDGELVRVLTVMGTRISSDPTQRVPQDPRGATGPVHQSTTVSQVYSAEEKS